MKHLIFATALALATTAAAAADLPVKAPPYEPSLYSWTGPWIGAYLGYAVNDTSQQVLLDGVPLADIGAAPKGFLGGVNAGYNIQLSPLFVFGFYIEQDFADLRATGNALGNISASNVSNYLGAAGGRLGYLIDPSTLLYVKGGGAWVGAKPDFAAIGTAKGISDTSFGWQAGAGLEHRFSANWSVKIEFDHTQAGDKQIDIPFGAVETLSSVTKFHIEKGEIGLNYIF